MLKTGIVGTVVALICCLTPALVILFGSVGLGGLTGYLDFVLIPTLVVFVAMVVIALWRRKHA